MRATDGTSREVSLLPGGVPRAVVDWVLAASMILVLAAGVFLLVRRAAGALTTALPVPHLLATAAALLAWAIVVCALSAMRRVYVWLSLAGLLLFALACSYPGNRIVDWFVWSAALFGLVLYSHAYDRATHGKLLRGPERRRADTGKCGELNTEKVLQHLTRCRTADGRELIRGELTAEFAPGERQAELYVAFCPPFERLPHVEANIAGDIDADIKLAQILHNGALLDMRLSQPAAETTLVAVEIFAAEAQAD